MHFDIDLSKEEADLYFKYLSPRAMKTGCTYSTRDGLRYQRMQNLLHKLSAQFGKEIHTSWDTGSIYADIIIEAYCIWTNDYTAPYVTEYIKIWANSEAGEKFLDVFTSDEFAMEMELRFM